MPCTKTKKRCDIILPTSTVAFFFYLLLSFRVRGCRVRSLRGEGRGWGGVPPRALLRRSHLGKERKKRTEHVERIM
ncbi:hypothetical protein TRSC58_07373 [Trypanosoma rangeli SC58]|uniref:Uncharacterized protein n=1 Tax=Trypanosoma rangeli SC58 TaxID=429131 RepID=A0A061ITD8_TRYRA|nr:hypothetical protein TRSC58_07373 [Trypanosoma rangeli SC58]